MCSPEIGELSLATEGYEHQQRVYRFGLQITVYGLLFTDANP